jgi:phosphoesterase RecJ-like protein
VQGAFHRVAVHLRKAKSAVLCAHVRPDGDAIGSVLALTLALRSIGVAAVPTLADERPAPSTYSFLPGHALYVPPAELEAPEVFVALDTPIPERLGVARQLADSAASTIVIDHHPDALEWGTVNLLDSVASATGQIVWELLDALEVRPTPEIATCCYAALATDTGRFAFQNTTPRALHDAAFMVEAGASPADIARLVYQERSPASLAIETIAMQRLTVVNDGRVAWTFLTDEDFETSGALPEEAEHLPDAIRQLRGVDVVALLRQKGDEVRGNLRAKGSFDVGAVARSLGGGGHAPAAGFTVDGKVADVIDRLLPLLPGGDQAGSRPQ